MEAVVVQSEYEFQRGKTMPSKNHAIVQTNLVILLWTHYKDKYKALSELSLSIGSKERVPDVSICAKLDFTPGKDEIKVSDMPLGVVEILSPSQALDVLVKKAAIYFDAGIQSYWLVIPDLRSIYVYSSKEDFEVYFKDETLIDTNLGIKLKLSEVFS